MRILLSERAANNNNIRVIFLNQMGNAKGNAESNVGIGGFAADRGSLSIVFGTKGGARGDVAPFMVFAFKDVANLTWTDRGGIFGEYAVTSEAEKGTRADFKMPRNSALEPGVWNL